MRALTVQQPWAWAIVHGGKNVENRTQAWGYRGPLAIHAGARVSQRGQESPLVVRALGDAMRRDDPTDLVFGAFIGVANLVDGHLAHGDEHGPCCDSLWAETSYDQHEAQLRAKYWRSFDGEPERHRVHVQGETPPMPFPDVILAHLDPPRETA